MSRVRFALDHGWAPGRMSNYLDGELSARERDRMERHVGKCADCRGLLAGLRVVVAALHVLPTPKGGPDPAQVAGAVRARLGQTPAS